MGEPNGSESEAPRDAMAIASILRAMGVESYDDRVVNQLLELMSRYIGDVLEDARTYSEHANKNEIDSDDVKLAIQARAGFSFTTPPPREVVLKLARERNSIPLPSIEPGTGIKLPPEAYQLTAQNYQIRVEVKVDDRFRPATSEPNKLVPAEASPKEASKAGSVPMTGVTSANPPAAASAPPTKQTEQQDTAAKASENDKEERNEANGGTAMVDVEKPQPES